MFFSALVDCSFEWQGKGMEHGSTMSSFKCKLQSTLHQAAQGNRAHAVRLTLHVWLPAPWVSKDLKSLSSQVHDLIWG